MQQKFSNQLQDILNTSNLTEYGFSQLVGAETDEPIQSIQGRLNRWLTQPPVDWQKIERDLNALGYVVKIEKL